VADIEKPEGAAGRRLRILQGARTLSGLDQGEAAELAGLSRCQTYARGDRILWPGEGSEWSILVDCGCARVYQEQNGKEATLLLIHEGEILPTSSERMHIDAVEEPTTVCRIPRRRLRDIEAHHPEIAARIEDTLTQRLSDMGDLVGDLICLDASGRLAHVLSRLADHDGAAVTITREALASMVGARRQQITTSLCYLRDLGLIAYKTHAREIIVLDRKALADLTTKFPAVSDM
jgi:CRP-like cAMP-binding protein